MRYRIFVRTRRMRWALSQKDLAGLLNRSPTRLSRYENGEDSPDLETALGLQVVFGDSPRALFPALYTAIEEKVMSRAAKLDKQLSGKIGHAADTQRRLLKGMTHRARGESDAT